MSIEELLQREETAWARLADTLAAVRPERREVEGVVPGWSAHDVAWHCVYWAGDAGEVLERVTRWRAGPPGHGRARRGGPLHRARHGLGRDPASSRAGPRTGSGGALGVRRLPAEGVGAVQGRDFRHYDEHEAQIRAFSA